MKGTVEIIKHSTYGSNEMEMLQDNRKVFRVEISDETIAYESKRS